MHSKVRFPNQVFGASLRLESATLAMLVLLLFLLFVVLFMTFTAQVAQGQNSTSEHNRVPATAREAAALPAFASRLHPHPAQSTLARPHRPSPLDQVIYENGPVNGSIDAWTINYGYVISDSFPGGTVSGFDIWVWEFPGDVMQRVDWSLTSDPNGGTVFGSGTANVTDTFISSNQYGYNIDKVSVSGLNVNASGTAWLNLQNAVVPSGDPVYWDENSGTGCHSTGCPSQAEESSLGTIPSEAFDVVGSSSGSTCIYDDPQHQFKIIHSFSDKEGSPEGVAIGQAGKIYGATGAGGDNNLGMAYKLVANGQNWFLTSLYSFVGDDNGQSPWSPTVGPDGALYGVADGGNKTCGSSGDQYCGLVYRLKPSPVACFTALCSWNEEVLYRFTGGPDGWQPTGHLVFDQAGNLYGVTSNGGWPFGRGAVYELTSSSGGWTEQVIYSVSESDGDGVSSLLMGHDGNLYGTTLWWVKDGGIAFQLAPSGGGWTENVIARFGGCSHSSVYCRPLLVQESGGIFYGIDSYEKYFQQFYWDYWDTFGTIFTMSRSGGNWNFAVIDDAANHWGYWGLQDKGYDIFRSLAVDAAGTVYATESAWIAFCGVGNSCDVGGIYEVQALGHDRELVSFIGDNFGDVEVGAGGNLYGTTARCGAYGHGTVWQLTP